jgi:hypothetical protein
MSVSAIRPDEHGFVSLDGTWDFHPADLALHELEHQESVPLEVPGLWEAQGFLDLDGVAWYRRQLRIDEPQGFWTLAFGAVMDIAQVYVNGDLAMENDNAFTPFSADVSRLLRPGVNTIAVRVTDPPLSDPEHIRLAHGKQGWANHVFPSRPSLYLTYGGIWQPVSLQRHGPVVVEDVFVNGDPDDLRVQVELTNRSDEELNGRLGVRAVGLIQEVRVHLGPREARTVTCRLGPSVAERWCPSKPVLHDVLADVVLDDGQVSHRRRVRFGLRTIRVDGKRLLLNDEPYRMKAALVQGFRADTLYAEGGREAIEEEVRAALDMGFNTLRLHIKAFDPTYLAVCDELGMLLHCDVPVAEPIAYDELGGETVVTRRSVEAVERQIRRDRNHPSIMLWSAMNELCLDGLATRYTSRYEQFARKLAAAVERSDPTRPYIENDWIEPEPERVFCAPVLTAHWYGRLHADYLRRIEESSAAAATLDRPFLVTEYGDWGLPEMPELPEPPFWDTRQPHAAGLAGTRWPGTIGRFVLETQRYQGISDRLQTEVFRRHDHIGGYCLTELTDVPHELNGLLDLNRRPKTMAVDEMRRANQDVLPMLELETLVVAAGEYVAAPLHVANDGPQLEDVEISVYFSGSARTRSVEELVAVDARRLSLSAALARFTESDWALRIGSLPGYRCVRAGRAIVAAPDVTGSHDLVLELRAGGHTIASNRYPIHVVKAAAAAVDVRLLGGDGTTAAAVAKVGATCVENGGIAVVSEGGLDATAAKEARAALAVGETVVVLAQTPDQAPLYPGNVLLTTVETRWGSSVFHFTTEDGSIPTLPRQAVLVAEDSTVQALSALTRIDGTLFPQDPVVIAYKPAPRSLVGTILGSHRTGGGRMIICQYRLSRPAAGGDGAARALLADLLRMAAVDPPTRRREHTTLADGRAVTLYPGSEGTDT